MINFGDVIPELLARGYRDENVEEKLAQDILLKALSGSGFKDNVTIKGGVVMANLTKDVRRTTLDLDIDFMRYPLDDESIRKMVERMNCVEGVTITLIGDILELKQQDYHGKRVFVSLQDTFGNVVESKIDIGVHVVAAATQRESQFDIETVSSEAAVLFANTPEQVFVEKLKSLLRLGAISNRAKDVDDMLYLSSRLDLLRLRELLKVYVYDDPRMLERNAADIVRRVRATFSNPRYLARLSHRRANWLQIDPKAATWQLLAFFESL